MIRNFLMIVTLIFFLSSNSFAGLGYSSQYSRDQGTIIGAIEIEGKGIYNLLISVNYLRRPQNKKVFKSDEYERLVDRLSVEWRGIALQKVLESKPLKVTELARLKSTIKDELDKLTTDLKNKLMPNQNIEVVYSISNFFLLEPKEK